jgi:tetratricopeptide (TPR) repeat protein
MKKTPSFGFVYLVFITLITFWFFSWVVAEGWYDRIHTPSQEDKDLKKWASYLEDVASEFGDKSVQKETLDKAGSLYMKIGNKRSALRIYKRLTKLFPDNNSYLSKLTALLYTEPKCRAEAIESVKKLYRSRDKDKYIDENMLQVLLLQHLDGDKEIDKNELVQLIFSGEYTRFRALVESGNIALCNLTPDRWSTNMKPFFIAIKNPYGERIHAKFELGCWPSRKLVPVVVEIKGTSFQKKLVFDKKNKFHTITFAVAPGEVGLFKGNTNKTWRAPKDPRKLGVNVRFEEVVRAKTAEVSDVSH